MTILPSVSFGNAYWYALLLNNSEVVIDPYENFVKQTYRSRFEIATSQGNRFLSVPVQSQKGIKTPLAEVLIHHDDYWKSQHLKTIESAYNSSPFYLYYQDELTALYQRDFNRLHDFNRASIEMIVKVLELEVAPQFSNQYQQAMAHDTDSRALFKPATLNKHLEGTNFFPRYIQVFEPKLGFQSNLSILDLLFNLGPETEIYLESIL